MRSKNLAKMAAALNACKELHRIGELDDDLLPVCSLSDEESESEEEEDECDGKKRKKPGTKKRKRVYERKVKMFSTSFILLPPKYSHSYHTFVSCQKQKKPFSCAKHRLHVSLRVAPVACFPACSTGCMFSRV